jgi:hypothetical protein
MRLLNVRTYKLKEFSQKDVPPYAILSHTWDEVEITLRDLDNEQVSKLPGFQKIHGCCDQANKDGFDYVVSPVRRVSSL